MKRAAKKQKRARKSVEEASVTASVPLTPLNPPSDSTYPKRKGPVKTRTLTTTPLHKDLIYHVDNFFTPSECTAWINYAENTGFSEIDSPATRETAFRKHARVQVDLPATAAGIWERLERLLPGGMRTRGVGCFENIRIYRYAVGERFGRHIDESVDVGERSTGVTVLVYLSDVEGGETVFYDGRGVLEVRPSVGGLLVHGHGDRCLEHEARAVRSGVKYVLRTDVVYE